MTKPTYGALLVEAISALKDRTGSSLQAIKSYISSKYPDFNFQAVSAIRAYRTAI